MLASAVGTNRYAYAANDPVNKSDPNGHLLDDGSPESEWEEILNAIQAELDAGEISEEKAKALEATATGRLMVYQARQENRALDFGIAAAIASAFQKGAESKLQKFEAAKSPRAARDLAAAKSSNSTFVDLSKAAQRAVESVGPGRGPVYGTRVHSALRQEVAGMGDARLRAEVSFKDGGEVPYGTPGAVRLDVVEFDAAGRIVRVYDLKTGSATLSQPRAQAIQSAVGAKVPVIELRGQ